MAVGSRHTHLGIRKPVLAARSKRLGDSWLVFALGRGRWLKEEEGPGNSKLNVAAYSKEDKIQDLEQEELDLLLDC